MRLKFFKISFLTFFFSLLLFIYLFLIWSNFKAALSFISESFGYMDYQHHWRLLDDFVKLKMPFRDYVLAPSHGWVYLLIQSIPYLIFKQTFLAVLVVRQLYLPIMGVILSYFVAKNVLGKKYLILIFLFFCLLFKINYVFESPRHLVAELSLSFFILFFLENKPRHLLISGVIAGLSAVTSLEYGVALNIAILFILLASFLSKIKLKKLFLNKFLLGEIVILIPYFSWLYFKGVLKNYWEFSWGFINNFYYASPCSGDSFPRLSGIQTLAPVSKLLIFNLPIEFLQKVNLYLVLVFFIVCLLVIFSFFVKERKFSQNSLIKFSLIIYGLLISLRTLDNPCIGYFTYSLVPFFLLLTFLMGEVIAWSKRKKSFVFRIIAFFSVVMPLSWFVLTENTGYLIRIFGKKGVAAKESKFQEKEFYSPVGWLIDTKLSKGYQEVASYILENTSQDDFLYVYPWGPYNNLTSREPPNSLPTTIHFLAGEQFRVKTKKELEIKKPKFIIINIYNNLGIAQYGRSRGDVTRFFGLGSEEGPVFAGEGDLIQKYILENYKAVFQNDLAIVMARRQKPIVVEMQKEPIHVWQPAGEEVKMADSQWTLVLDQPIEASEIVFEFKFDGDFLTKHLSRYFVLLSAWGEDQKQIGETKILARKSWQTEKIVLSQLQKIKTLKIAAVDNTGLIWWWQPYRFQIKEIGFYK